VKVKIPTEVISHYLVFHSTALPGWRCGNQRPPPAAAAAHGREALGSCHVPWPHTKTTRQQLLNARKGYQHIYYKC